MEPNDEPGDETSMLDHDRRKGTVHSSASRAMRREYRGCDVVDPAHRLIGTISDLVMDGAEPRWAVVELGLLRSSHYLPLAAGRLSDAGEFVVPFDKRMVRESPQADRAHRPDESTRRRLRRHYELA